MSGFDELLHRLRLRKEDRRKEGTATVKTVTKKNKGAFSSVSSNRIAALAQAWSNSASLPQDTEVVDVDEESPISSPSPALSAPAPVDNIPRSDQSVKAPPPRSALAPSSRYLPPLLQNTVGCRQTAPDRAGASLLSVSASTGNIRHSSAAGRAAARGAFSCVVVDLETTGLDPDTHEIVEIGCVELRWNPSQPFSPAASEISGAELPELATSSPQTWYSPESIGSFDSRSVSFGNLTGGLDGFWARGPRRFHRYVRPSSPAAFTAAAVAVHGITWDRVCDCDEWAVVARELARFFHQIAMDSSGSSSSSLSAASSPSSTAAVAHGAERVALLGCTQLLAVQMPPIVAHNASFDTTFLERHLQSCGYYVVWDAHYPVTCTMKWTRKAYPHVACNLNAICKFLGVEGATERASGYHGAMVDATLTARLFLQLCRRWEEDNARNFL